MLIITNTAVTLDGRISASKSGHKRFASEEDLKQMSLLRNMVDAILVGGMSFRAYPHPLFPNPAHVPVGLRAEPIWNVVVSRTMKFNLKADFLKPKVPIRPLFLAPKKNIPKSFPLASEGSLKPITPRWIVDVLARRGVKTLLIEGGGDIIHQFLKSKLVDEMYITLCPKIIGLKGAPTLADGAGFSGLTKNLQLRDFRLKEGELFLHYRVL